MNHLGQFLKMAHIDQGLAAVRALRIIECSGLSGFNFLKQAAKPAEAMCSKPRVGRSSDFNN
jgi:hypothetical protein